MSPEAIATWLRPRRVFLWPAFSRSEYNRWAREHYELPGTLIEAAHDLRQEAYWWMARAFCAAMQRFGLRPEDLTVELLNAFEPILSDMALPNTFRLIGPWREVAEAMHSHWRGS